MSSSRCPACGAPRHGAFCARCGAALGGSAISRGGTPGGNPVAVRVAGVCVGILAIVAGWVLLDPPRVPISPAVRPAVAETSDASPPDLSTMSPRERFDRLYNRVMRAAEQGDTATVTRFSPMAFLAYEQLDTVDADARYHAAVLRLHVQGDTAAALRLADTIQMSTPRHLFAFLLRGTAARLTEDARLLGRAESDFLAAWETEMRAGRPEYRDHQAMLEQFRDKARQSSPRGTPP